MDKFEALATQAPRSTWLILGNPAKRDFVVLPLAECPLPQEIEAAYHGRGFVFVGAVGIVDGAPHTCLAVLLDNETLDMIAAQASRAIEAELSRRLAVPEIADHAERAMFAAYMEHLMSLGGPPTEDA